MIFLEKETDFFELIKNDLVLVDFYATWCGPCRSQAPILENIEKNHEDVEVIKVDVEECETLATEYKVLNLPTILIFKNGEPYNKFVGLTQEKTIEEVLK